MRLIDADAVLKELKKSCEYHAENSRELSLLQRDIIIVQEQPTVDAIPIEWILNYKDKYTVITSEECNPVKAEVIADMLADWAERKEE